MTKGMHTHTHMHMHTHAHTLEHRVNYEIWTLPKGANKEPFLFYSTSIFTSLFWNLTEKI